MVLPEFIVRAVEAVMTKARLFSNATHSQSFWRIGLWKAAM
jgi:hypothetical protein